MFSRPNNTYAVTPEQASNVLRDETNALTRISHVIPEGAKVLDVGAGNGILARMLLKTHRNIIIDGIEPNAYASQLARSDYRKFYTGFAHEFWPQALRQEEYDYIVMADVIEHINDPFVFLGELLSELPNKTKIILSIPNVAFGSVRVSLLNGCFDYVDSGLLERTHLRFFTLKTIESLARELGLNIEKLHFLQKDLFSSEIRVENFDVDIFSLHKIGRDPLASTYQFVLVLSKERIGATEIEYFGDKTRYPVLRYLNMRFGMKRVLAKVKRLFTI